MNIIPIMYSLGIEVIPIPTELFTSHGGFKGVMRKDNSDFMVQYTSQYKELNISFNGIYIGLFTSLKQLEKIQEFLYEFNKNDTLVVLDTILGDNGKLYSFVNKNIIEEMRVLVKKANIITPNLTEAYFLLDKKYNENPSYEDVVGILKELSCMGPDKIILTSVNTGSKLCTYTYEKEAQKVNLITRERLEGSYPGTGDAFTAVVFGKLLNGKGLEESVNSAADFVEDCIKIILQNNYNPLEGLPLGEYLSKGVRYHGR